ncbi:hypothetical protein HYV87_03160 [Candidatus Woesearchaeota archaeon]|nr:hypothetical protein [Candidatus Woesearchaeota archaeon]
MSKIANSGIGKSASVIIGAGTAIIPTADMLNPPAVYAEQNIDYDKLIEQIKASKDTFPVRIQKDDGSEEVAIGYRLSGYNPDLKDFVDFYFLPIGNGMLKTRIRKSPFVPKSVSFGKNNELSLDYSLFIYEGGQSPVDGKPESVGIEKTTTMNLGQRGGTRIEIETMPLTEYKIDPIIQRGVLGDYFIALTRTILSKK